MVKQMNDNILKEIDNIVSFIKDSSEYKEYLLLKEKSEKNEKVKALISEIKTFQKEAVKRKINNLDFDELDQKINNNLDELNKIPLYVEFINIQEELNDMYQGIKNRLDEYFYDKLN